MAVHEPKELHLNLTMPTDDGPVPVVLSVYLCERDGSGFCCQVQIRKKGIPHRLWAELMPGHARTLSRRLKAAAKWLKRDGGDEEHRP